MGSLADYAENKILDHVLSVSAMSLPSGYLALGTAADDTGLTAEVSGNGYARVSVPGTSWGSAASRQIANSSAISFPTATGSWGSPSYWALYDASSGGNCIAYGDITTPRAIGSGQTPSFAIGEIPVSWNASGSNIGWSDYLVHKCLEHLVGKTTYTAETLYVGFCTTPCTDSGGIAGEASGGGYARVSPGTFSAAAGGATDNDSQIPFTVSGTWTASLDNLFIANHATGTAAANLLFFSTITPFSAVSGDNVAIAAGELDISVS